MVLKQVTGLLLLLLLGQHMAWGYCQIDVRGEGAFTAKDPYWDYAIEVEFFSGQENASWWYPVNLRGGFVGAYQGWVRSKTQTHPKVLINKQYQLFQPQFPELNFRFEAILSGRVGQIEQIRCIEAYFLEKHFRIRGDYKELTEFALEVFRNPKTGQMRLIHISSPIAGIPLARQVRMERERLLDTGWIFASHIHNHPFQFHNRAGDIAGTLVPSGHADSGDVSVYLDLSRRYGLQKSVVTNGFHSITFYPDEFPRLAYPD